MAGQSNGSSRVVDLPRYPFPTLESLAELTWQGLACLGTEEEAARTKRAIDELLAPKGIVQRLQDRLRQRDEDPSTENWLANYADIVWLQGRDWLSRGERNPSIAPSGSKTPHSQVERAALWSLAAYEYKLARDAGTLPQEYNELGHAQCMNSVGWLFNSGRVPQPKVDRVRRWPGEDYIVAIRNGHAYKVSLIEPDGATISHQKLKSTFKDILEKAPSEVNWVNILTSGNRDEWFRIRNELLAFSPSNEKLFSVIERSLFLVCLEDNAPETESERFEALVQDDSRSRWLDKTLSFVVLKNGESSIVLEHSMMEARGAYGLLKHLQRSTVNHVEVTSPEPTEPSEYTYFPADIPTSLESEISSLRSQHLSSVQGYKLYKYTHKRYGLEYLRSKKLQPKSTLQVALQLAFRKHYGHTVGTFETVCLRHFKLGRVEGFNAAIPEMEAFCKLAEDAEYADGKELRKLFLEAVMAHSKLVSLIHWGRGWSRHLKALQFELQEGETPPPFFSDPLYHRYMNSKTYTLFLDADIRDGALLYPNRDCILIWIRPFEDRVEFTFINGDDRGEDFIESLKEALATIRPIIAGIKQ